MKLKQWKAKRNDKKVTDIQDPAVPEQVLCNPCLILELQSLLHATTDCVGFEMVSN